MIQTDHVSVNYKEGNREHWAVNDVSLTFASGSFTSIVGRSGSGKTSLLNVIGGLLVPDKGEVLVLGDKLSEFSEKQLAEYRSRHIGYIFQNFYLEPNYSIEQNIEIALMIGAYPTKQRKEKVVELLKSVEMEGMQHVKVKNISGGERQRVCIARALANDPEIILADEPCGNLDTYNGQIIMKLLQRLVDQDKAVILVTHNMEDAYKTERVIELRDGIVVRDEKN